MGSVYEEISRLETAKLDIETAIETCGVNVPNTELINTYASYIRQIPSAVFSELNVDTIGGSDKFIQSIKQTNGKIEATVGELVSSSNSGLVPKIGSSAASTITTSADEWVLASTKGGTPTWRKLPTNAFKNDTYTFTGGNGSFTVTPSGGTDKVVSIGKPATAGTADKLICEAGTDNSFRHVWFSYNGQDGRLVYDDDFTYNPATNVLKVGSITGSANTATNLTTAPSLLISNNTIAVKAGEKTSSYITVPFATSSTTSSYAASAGSVAWLDITNKPTSFTPSSHNHPSSQINLLTGYSKATTAAALATTDTLNVALGKLEYKSDLGVTAYNLVNAAYDGDGTIENLKEILKVLEGISDTDTIQAIIGKYLPLSGGTMNGSIKFNSSSLPGKTLQYICGVDAFNNGGEMGYMQGSTFVNQYAPTKTGVGASGTWGINITGSAETATTATKLQTARKISLDTGVTGLATSFDGTDNITIPVTEIKEAYLSWGGKNLVNSFSPIDAALVPNLGANRLAFMPPEAIEIEYSRDGGITWNDYGATDEQKLNMFCGLETNIRIGKSEDTGIDKSNYQVRIIITADIARVYTSLCKFVIKASTQGSSGCWCTIDAKNKGNFDAGNDTWTVLADKQPINGWPAYNVINISSNTIIGNNRSNYFYKLRFTFGVTSHPSTMQYLGFIVNQIQGFGGVGWDTPSDMARYGVIYSYNYRQDVTFPSRIYAPYFIKNGSSDFYVLLGAGGHKAISDFMLKSEVAKQELNNNLTTITKSLTVTADWMNTGISSTNIPTTGTYIVQVSVHNSADNMLHCYWSGIMSWYASNTNDTDTDEIILHRSGYNYGNTIYLRTVMQSNSVLKLQIAANKTLSTAATYTFKFKRVI